jgi:hypothetical protein
MTEGLWRSAGHLAQVIETEGNKKYVELRTEKHLLRCGADHRVPWSANLVGQAVSPAGSFLPRRL